MSKFSKYIQYIASPRIHWSAMRSIDVVGHPHRPRAIIGSLSRVVVTCRHCSAASQQQGRQCCRLLNLSVITQKSARSTRSTVMGWPKRKSKEDGEASAPKAKKAGPDPLDFSGLDFSSEAKTKDDKKWNKKFASWNVNGVRAWLDKNAHAYITAEDPDIFCLQETKCEKSKIPREADVEGYHVYWLSGDKEGYSGTGLYSKEEPKSVSYGIGSEEHDKEGRVITAEYDDYYFVTAYVPNSGRGLVRLDYRTKEWDPAFKDYICDLDKKKPVILCGDLNVAHLNIDLSNPKSNRNKTPGFTDAERENMTALLEAGFVDTYRHLYPEREKEFSFWTYMMNARAKNAGWRLDYFILSERIQDKLCDSMLRTQVFGSDHCPAVCLMHM